MGSWRTPAEKTESLIVLAHRLTDRDRAIISDLGRLRVLTLEQIAKAHFTSKSSARDRMDTLRELGVVDRFRPSTRAAYRYVLSWSGLRLHHAAVEEARLAQPTAYRAGGEKPRPAPSRPAADALIARLIANPMRAHLEAVNDFYTRLAASCRASDGVDLVRWYGEAEATALLDVPYLRPDGAFEVEVAGQRWRCWFEHDTGSELASVLAGKATTYRAQLSHKSLYRHFGNEPQCLLFELTKPGREANLHPALAEPAEDFTIATCTTDRSADPLGPIWQLAGETAGRLRTFAELPARLLG